MSIQNSNTYLSEIVKAVNGNGTINATTNHVVSNNTECTSNYGLSHETNLCLQREIRENGKLALRVYDSV